MIEEFNKIDDRAQGTVIATSFFLGTLALLALAFSVDFIKEIVFSTWWAFIIGDILMMVACSPVGFFIAKATTTCEKCQTPWVKYEKPEDDHIIQIFPRTEKRNDKYVSQEVTRYYRFTVCNCCGHTTKKEKEKVRVLNS